MSVSLDFEQGIFSVLDNSSTENQEILTCLICLKNGTCSDQFVPILNKDKLSNLFNGSSRLLKVELTDTLVNLFNSSKIVSFCKICENVLICFTALEDQLNAIKCSIQKIETNMKIQVIKSKLVFQPSQIENGESDTFLFQRFYDLAIRDYSPSINLLKYIVPERKNTKKPKMCRRKRTKSALGTRKNKNVKIDKVEENFNNIITVKEEVSDLNDLVSFEDTNVNGLCNEVTENETNINTDGISSTADGECKIEINNWSDEFHLDDFGGDESHSDVDYTPSRPNKNSDDDKKDGKSNNSETKRRRRNAPISSDGTTKRKRKRYINNKKTKEPAMKQISDSTWSFRSIKYTYKEDTRTFHCGYTYCKSKRKSHSEMHTHISNYHPVEGFGKWTYNGVKFSIDKETGRLKCDICNKIAKSRITMVTHIKSRHSGKIVTTGGREYKARMFLDPPVELEEGRKWLYRGVEFTKDIINEHYNCGSCGRVRKNTGSMRLHIAECHDEQAKKENECETCGRQFGTSYSLNVHKITHLDTKTYQCEQCGQVFQHRSNMYRHIARIHNQVRPYVCEYCGKAFFSKKDCRVHRRIHTKEKPYFCDKPDCGMSFSILATLQNHRARIHPINVETSIITSDSMSVQS